MKKILIILTILISTMLVSDCKKEEGTSIGGGMASVDDSTSQKNVVSIAKGSKDHTTLVAAVAAAD
ncbi:MAG TPA: fasciclin domain-containing protein, partial [Leptospiraceae bacterium]|nr:fasciclin domain-containing protein [Leptospiraceae bacterium]